MLLQAGTSKIPAFGAKPLAAPAAPVRSEDAAKQPAPDATKPKPAQVNTLSKCILVKKACGESWQPGSGPYISQLCFLELLPVT